MPLQPAVRGAPFAVPGVRRGKGTGGTPKKFSIPLDPLQVEPGVKEIAPPPAQFVAELEEQIANITEAKFTTGAVGESEAAIIRKQCWKIYANEVYQQIRANIKHKAAKKFRCWLATEFRRHVPTFEVHVDRRADGDHKTLVYKEGDPLPDGQTGPLPKVASDYLRAHIKAAYEFQGKIINLTQTRLKTLNDYWLYYKFITCGPSIDINGDIWHEVPLDYLGDFKLRWFGETDMDSSAMSREVIANCRDPQEKEKEMMEIQAAEQVKVGSEISEPEQPTSEEKRTEAALAPGGPGEVESNLSPDDDDSDEPVGQEEGAPALPDRPAVDDDDDDDDDFLTADEDDDEEDDDDDDDDDDQPQLPLKRDDQTEQAKAQLEINRLEGLMVEKESTLAETKERLRELREGKRESDTTVQSQQEELDRMKNEIDTLRETGILSDEKDKKLDDLQSKLDASETLTKELAKKASEEEKGRTLAQNQLETAKEKAKAHKEKAQALADQLAKKEGLSDERASELKAQQKAVKAAQKESDALIKDLTKKATEEEKGRVMLEKKLTSADKRMKTAQDKVQALTDALADKEETSTERVSELESQLKKAESQLKGATTANTNLRTKLDKLTAATGDTQKQQENITKLKLEIADLRERESKKFDEGLRRGNVEAQKQRNLLKTRMNRVAQSIGIPKENQLGKGVQEGDFSVKELSRFLNSMKVHLESQTVQEQQKNQAVAKENAALRAEVEALKRVPRPSPPRPPTPAARRAPEPVPDPMDVDQEGTQPSQPSQSSRSSRPPPRRSPRATTFASVPRRQNTNFIKNFATPNEAAEFMKRTNVKILNTKVRIKERVAYYNPFAKKDNFSWEPWGRR